MYDYVGSPSWTISSVYDLAVWRNGLAFRDIDFSDFGRPIIKIAELKNYITHQTARTMASYDPSVFIRSGDMLFSWSGNPDTSIDVFRWEGEDGWLNQHIFKVTPKNHVSDQFLFFVLRWLRPRFAEIARNKQTTGLGHVTIQDLKEMRVGVPPDNEQSAIVDIVGPLQDKIDLNRRMNETIEAMARALFKDWFIDFGPTRAKMQGEKAYLKPEIWSLFPDRLDDEEKPEGWRALPLGNVCELNPAERLPTGVIAPYLEMAALPTRGSIHDVPEHRIFSSGTKFRDGDTLLARITPCLENGKTAFVRGIGKGVVGWGSTEFIVIRPKPPLTSAFGYLVARDPGFRDHAIRSMTGTSGRQRAQTDQLANYPIIMPSEAIACAFGKTIADWFNMIAANAIESESVASFRDLLLPKLMSGELRIKDAEKAAAEVA